MTPDSEPARLPAVLLTGFLGAGKTTFLNRMLDWLRRRPERVCLIINEFGRIGIDAGLVSAGPETIHEVNAGSIFCVCTRDKFLAALDGAARADPPFDLLVIEATGVAATSDLGGYIYGPPVDGRVRVAANVCLVDAANFHKVRATLPAAVNQVEEASAIVLNKADLVDAKRLGELRRELHDLNPRAPVHVAVQGEADMDRILGGLAGGAEWRARGGLAETPPADAASVSLEADGVLDPDALDRFLGTLPDSLLRGKGTLLLPDGAEYREWVMGGWAARPFDAAPVRTSRLVLIGPALDAAALAGRFRACARAAE